MKVRKILVDPRWYLFWLFQTFIIGGVSLLFFGWSSGFVLVVALLLCLTTVFVHSLRFF